MSQPLEVPWSDSPNAPKIPDWLHFWEKVYLAGALIGAIFYGIVIVLFFQCMGALFDPVNRTRGGIKWKFVVHTVAMFSFVTIYTAATLYMQSSSFVDNREFPGTATIPPGPVGYQWFIRSKGIGITPTIMLVINNWLADGLLLYRCCIVYATNYWAIAFPCVMYLACLATGITFVHQVIQPGSASAVAGAVVHYGTPYFSICFSLNVLLTFMIITRLILHRKNIRNSMGATASIGKLYKTAVIILIESCTLYVVGFLLFVGVWAAGSPLQYLFLQVLAQTQVIAPFLITLHVAKQRPLANDAVVSGNVRANFNGQGKPVGGNEALPGVYSAGSVDVIELGIGVETATDLSHDRVSGFEGSLKV